MICYWRSKEIVDIFYISPTVYTEYSVTLIIFVVHVFCF